MNVQDLMSKLLLESNVTENDTVQILDFIRENGVPLNNEQVEACFLLDSMELQDISKYVHKVRKFMLPFKSIIKSFETMTLANRIKGTAKLDNVLKQDANPGLNLNFDKAAKGGR